MRSVAAELDSGYFHNHRVTVTRGKHKQFMSYWNNRVKPVYEQLLSDGAIVAYGLSSEAITTRDPMGTSWWVVMPDADGFDTVRVAFEASWEAIDEEGRRARWLSIMDVVEEDSYREYVSNIIHLQIAAH